MPKGMGRFFLSSLGKKFVMAVTGLLLIGFLVVHLLENLTLFAGQDGAAFVAYVEGLHKLGPLLYVLELGLFLLFWIHIWMAIRLTVENRKARPVAYQVKNTFGESTLSSRTMIYSGLVVLAFLIVHLLHFRFRKGYAMPHAEALHARVVAGLTDPLFAAIYVVGALAVGFHLTHGFRSLFQSLGINHEPCNPWFRRIGIVLAIVLALGFASFPIVAMTAWRS